MVTETMAMNAASCGRRRRGSRRLIGARRWAETPITGGVAGSRQASNASASNGSNAATYSASERLV